MEAPNPLSPEERISWEEAKIKTPPFICQDCRKIPSISLITKDEIEIKCPCSKQETKKISLSSFVKELSEAKVELNYCDIKKNHKVPESATDYCKECKKWFCLNCLEVHKELLDGHEIKKSEGLFISNICEMQGCNRQIDYFCQDCWVHLCLECKDNHHKSHKIDIVKEIFNNENLDNFYENVQKKIAELDEENKLYEKYLIDLEEKIKKLRELIKEKKQEEKNLIKFFGSLSSTYLSNKNISNFFIRNNILINKIDKIEFPEQNKEFEKIIPGINIGKTDEKFEFQWKNSENFLLSNDSKKIKRINSEGWESSTVIGKKILQKGKIHKWRIKINKINRDKSGMSLGMITSDTDLESFCGFNKLWLMSCHGGYRTNCPESKNDNVSSGDYLDFIVNLVDRTFEIKLNENQLGMWSNIPKDRDLVPCVCLYYPNDEIELVE